MLCQGRPPYKVVPTLTVSKPGTSDLYFFRFFIPCTFYTCYNKNYQQMRLLYYVFISFFSSFPYMFRAFMSPSSWVFQAVDFMVPFGSKSALLIVCVRQRTGLWWWLRCTQHHKPVRWRTQKINKALHEPNGSIKTTAWNTPDDGLMKARNM